MTGSGLAQLIIPITGTLFLTAGLALVFYADRRPWRGGGTPAPGREIPGPAALAAQEDLLAASIEGENLRVIFEGER
jgi:hypothetical protein